MKILYVSLVFFALIFTGCGTKREYYEPKDISGEIIFNGSLPSKIVQVSRYAATLENGQIITKDGLSNITLDKGFTLVGEFDGKLISVDDNGAVKVLNPDGTLFYEKTFPQAVASASIKGNILAVVDSSNILYLVKIDEDSIYFTNKQDEVYALDSRIAAPIFINSLVVFPALDGKIVIVDWQKGEKVKDVVLSSKPFFNNVIYLNIANDQLIAATEKRVIRISSNKTAFFDENIKDVLISKDNLLVLTDDGRIVVLDQDLKIEREHKFLFAVFLGLVDNGRLLVAERNGHLISTDFDFNDIKVYKLPDEIDELMFLTKDTFYYHDKLTKLYE